MQSTVFDKRMRRVVTFLIGANMILLIVNVLSYLPVLSNGGLLGFVAATGILLIYGYLTLGSPIAVGKLPNIIWRGGVYLGICSGLVLSVDLISGYVLPDPTISTRTSLAAYGLFLILIFVSGFIGGRQTGKFTSGITAALWCVLTALLIWFFVEFAAYLLFSNTPSGAAFVRDEMQTDFIRSGMTDYQAFALSDFFGAGFFHLILGLIFSVILGFIGTTVGKVWNAIAPSQVSINR
ncbi:MAG: hypothetical protein ABI970_10865 [Chloroflexota bacterium]